LRNLFSGAIGYYKNQAAIGILLLIGVEVAESCSLPACSCESSSVPQFLGPDKNRLSKSLDSLICDPSSRAFRNPMVSKHTGLLQSTAILIVREMGVPDKLRRELPLLSLLHAAPEPAAPVGVL